MFNQAGSLAPSFGGGWGEAQKQKINIQEKILSTEL